MVALATAPAAASNTASTECKYRLVIECVLCPSKLAMSAGKLPSLAIRNHIFRYSTVGLPDRLLQPTAVSSTMCARHTTLRNHRERAQNNRARPALTTVWWQPQL